MPRYRHAPLPPVEGEQLLRELDLRFRRLEVAEQPVSSFADSAFEVYDDADSTKIVALQVSGVTTGTTRTLTIPDASGTIALTSDTPSLALSELTDVTITAIAANELLQWNGSAWVNQTLAEIGIVTTLDGLSDTTITSIGAGELLEWSGSAWINQTLAELNIGDITGTVEVTGAWAFTNATLKIGGTVASPDLTITDDSARDPRLQAPGGKMTLETLGSTTATGDGLYVDDGGTNDAKVASVKNITSSATAPTGDYPYGALHLIY